MVNRADRRGRARGPRSQGTATVTVTDTDTDTVTDTGTVTGTGTDPGTATATVTGTGTDPDTDLPVARRADHESGPEARAPRSTATGTGTGTVTATAGISVSSDAGVSVREWGSCSHPRSGVSLPAVESRRKEKWLYQVPVLLAVAALAGGQDAPPATPSPAPTPRALSLGLDRLLLQEGIERGPETSPPAKPEGGSGFDLGDLKLLPGGSSPGATDGTTPSPSSAPLRLHLDTRAFLATLDQGEKNRLRFDVTSAAAQREMARAMYPGLPGSATLAPQVAVGVSLRDIIGAIRAAIERARWERLPEGAKVPRTRTLELTVIPAFLPCESVVVQPLVLSWVGDTVGGACENDQRCVVAGVPAAAFTSLVRGAGAALMAIPEQGNPAPVQLRREGTLKLRPSPRTAVFPVDVRLLERGSHLVVPLHPSLNPQRGEWVTVSDAPLTILLPAGRYRVEMRAADGTITTLPVTVRADAIEEFPLP